MLVVSTFRGARRRVEFPRGVTHEIFFEHEETTSRHSARSEPKRPSRPRASNGPPRLRKEPRTPRCAPFTRPAHSASNRCFQIYGSTFCLAPRLRRQQSSFFKPTERTTSVVLARLFLQPITLALPTKLKANLSLPKFLRQTDKATQVLCIRSKETHLVKGHRASKRFPGVLNFR